MDTVIVRLVQDVGITARFICWWTWGRWSHVELVTKNKMALGARLKGGVAVRPLDYAKIKSELFIEIQVNDIEKFWQFANSQLGKPYDWKALLGLGIRANFANPPNKWFCSEFVFSCFQNVNKPILESHYAYRLSPRDIGLTTEYKRIVPPSEIYNG